MGWQFGRITDVIPPDTISLDKIPLDKIPGSEFPENVLICYRTNLPGTKSPAIRRRTKMAKCGS